MGILFLKYSNKDQRDFFSSIVYNMVAYKLKVIYVGNDTHNFFHIRYNGNAYTRVNNNYGDDYGTVIPDDGWLCGTGIPRGSDLYKKQH